jgi:hypothetical protein
MGRRLQIAGLSYEKPPHKPRSANNLELSLPRGFAARKHSGNCRGNRLTLTATLTDYEEESSIRRPLASP